MDYAPIRDTITVVGIGTIAAEPDTARITIGVTATHASPLRAHEAVANDANRVLQAIHAAGIPERDVRTSQLRVNTVAKFDEQHNYAGVSGYEVSTELAVTCRELGKVGALLEAAVAAGATDVRGIEFYVDDPSPLADQARVLAVADARARAGRIASAAGLHLTGVYAITEISAPSPGPQDYSPAPKMLASRMAAEMPVSPGESAIVVQVQAVFTVAPLP